MQVRRDFGNRCALITEMTNELLNAEAIRCCHGALPLRVRSIKRGLGVTLRQHKLNDMIEQ